MKQALALPSSLPNVPSPQPTAWSDVLVRTMILAFALAPAMRGVSQQPAQQPAASVAPEGSNWQHVQALPLGTSTNVKARKSHLSCALKSVDADSLTCTHGKDTVFQRAEILTIKIPHRGRSTLVGLAIGGGAGAVIGFGVGTRSGDGFFGPNFLRGAVTAVFAIIGGAAGTAVGAGTDFTHSTVYKAP